MRNKYGRELPIISGYTMNKSSYIIIDLRTLKALCGYGGKTLIFSSEEIAMEVAVQFFKTVHHFIIFDTEQIQLWKEQD